MEKALAKLLENKKNIVFIGEAGSGKSEIAMNIAVAIASGKTSSGSAPTASGSGNAESATASGTSQIASGSGNAESATASGSAPTASGQPTQDPQPKAVHFFDMDQTKPLFRSRDAKEALENAGVTFHYEEQFFDAPTLVGGVREQLADPNTIVIMDVGGNHQGARLIGGYAPFLNREETAVFFVINPYRPWSKDVMSIDGTLSSILKVSHIKKVGIISNPNVGAQTTVEEVIDGHRKVKEMIEEFMPIDCMCVMEDLYPQIKELAERQGLSSGKELAERPGLPNDKGFTEHQGLPNDKGFAERPGLPNDKEFAEAQEASNLPLLPIKLYLTSPWTVN